MITFVLLFALSFAGTYYAMPRSIRKLREGGYVVFDMYKPNKPKIPTNAGMIILFTSFVSIALSPLIFRFTNFIFNSDLEENIYDLSETNLAFLLVVSIYALYGLVDDLVDVGRKMKLVLPLTFGYPLISVVSPETIWLPFLGNFNLETIWYDQVSWNDIFRVMVVPVYVMVVSNMINMHSGYNGLQSGLSIILVSTLLFKSWVDDSIDRVFPAFSFLGAMLALWFFNKYPAKVFEGNIGSLLFGSVIGCIIVIQEYWWFGFFILLPHTFNFLLWCLWLILMKYNPDIYLQKDGQHQKFGSVDEKGIIKVPNLLTLKWMPNYYFQINENQTTNIMYFCTILFCLIGLLI